MRRCTLGLPVIVQDELIAIGKIDRPFGVRGEVRVRSLSDVPGRFENLKRVAVVASSGQSLFSAVKSIRGKSPVYILGLEAFTTPEEAACFRGGFLKIPKAEVPPLPSGNYYEFDLVGMSVREESGVALGCLEEILESPAHHVFVIRGESGERLLPAVKAVIQSVDVENRVMTVRWPDTAWEAADAV